VTTAVVGSGIMEAMLVVQINRGAAAAIRAAEEEEGAVTLAVAAAIAGAGKITREGSRSKLLVERRVWLQTREVTAAVVAMERGVGLERAREVAMESVDNMAEAAVAAEAEAAMERGVNMARRVITRGGARDPASLRAMRRLSSVNRSTPNSVKHPAGRSWLRLLSRRVA